MSTKLNSIAQGFEHPPENLQFLVMWLAAMRGEEIKTSTKAKFGLEAKAGSCHPIQTSVLWVRVFPQEFS